LTAPLQDEARKIAQPIVLQSGLSEEGGTRPTRKYYQSDHEYLSRKVTTAERFSPTTIIASFLDNPLKPMKLAKFFEIITIGVISN
jgi:hypothetical protein